jgi:hypothetical protein
VNATLSRLQIDTCVCNARQYSIVKDLDCGSNRYEPDRSGPYESLLLVGLGRIELPTSPLSGVRSSHLSYRPAARGFTSADAAPQLAASRLRNARRLSCFAWVSAATSLTVAPSETTGSAEPFHWWSWSGSNRRPPECKSGALPAELQPLTENTGVRRQNSESSEYSFDSDSCLLTPGFSLF